MRGRPPRAGPPPGAADEAEAAGLPVLAAVAAQDARQPSLPAVDEGAERPAAEGVRPPAIQKGRAAAKAL